MKTFYPLTGIYTTSRILREFICAAELQLAENTSFTEKSRIQKSATVSNFEDFTRANTPNLISL